MKQPMKLAEAQLEEYKLKIKLGEQFIAEQENEIKMLNIFIKYDAILNTVQADSAAQDEVDQRQQMIRRRAANVAAIKAKIYPEAK